MAWHYPMRPSIGRIAMESEHVDVITRMADRINSNMLHQVGHDARRQRLIDEGFGEFEVTTHMEAARELAASNRRRNI